VDCRREQEAILAKIRLIEQSAPAPVDQAIDIVGLMSRASELFLEQPPIEKRRLPQVVIEKAPWRGGEFQTTLFEPFEIPRHSNQESSSKKKRAQGLLAILRFGSPGRPDEPVSGELYRPYI
jgi:hypothetical protein